MVSKIFSIRNFAIKQLMKSGDDGIMKMPSQMKADFAEAMLTKQLVDAGIDPRLIKNEQQLVNILDGIDDMNRQLAEMATKEQKTGITSAKIMDIKGKEIPKGSKIMGGEAVETEAEIAARMNRENKLAVQNLKIKKEYDKAVKEGKFKGTEEDFRNKIDMMMDDIDNDFATGGRVGLKDGMDRRTFMKVMAGLASIPVVGKFFKGAKVASKATPKVMQNFSTTLPEPPTYFLKLVDKITKQGKPVTSTEDIMETYIYTSKNGDSYELVNDLKTGDLRITKDKTGIGSYGDKTFDTIEDRTVMEYKAPRKDVDIENRKSTVEQGEYEEYKVEFDQDGTEAGAEAIEERVQKEIIEESAEEAPSIKKADGGRVGLLKGGGILRTILTNLAKDKGMKPSEYLRLTNYKSLPDSTKRMISKDEFLKLKSDMTEKRIELMDTVKEMIASRQGFEKSKADLAASMNKASPGYGDKAVEMMFPPGSFKSPVPAGSGQKDVMMMEQLIKNLKTKDRQLNASGGVAYMLGE
jgi:hypothetical protein